jgi:DNA replicative helicase MCM subunit Mcm2 (Cdc46/Mcm family)
MTATNTIPDEILSFVGACVDEYDSHSISLEQIYLSKVTGQYAWGSGVVIKIDDAPMAKKYGNDRTEIRFNISDGSYSIECVADNADRALSPGGDSSVKSNPDRWLTQILVDLTESLQRGSKVFIAGTFRNRGRERVFIIDSLHPYSETSRSQMSDEQLSEFISLCSSYTCLVQEKAVQDTHGMPVDWIRTTLAIIPEAEVETYRIAPGRYEFNGVEVKARTLTPLDLMIREDVLWGRLYAKDYLKKAIMLFCLSPQTKQDMLHIGIVSSVGEGKDHMIEHVIEPLVTCGIAGTGKQATVAGLIGAMSGEDINSVSLGLLPKNHNERIAVSEFQTWADDTFGELMNAMANGYVAISKGNVHTRRETCTNILFLGNPPPDFGQNADVGEMLDKTPMLAAFGDYTYQIMSRLTLIFTQMSLAGSNAKEAIRANIMRTMDGGHEAKMSRAAEAMWRSFFREYLRAVSNIVPQIGSLAALVDSEFDSFENRETFRKVFIKRSGVETDYRKYQEFVNLVRAFARLCGSTSVTWHHLDEASELFRKSLQTLTHDFPIDLVNAQIDPNLIQKHHVAITRFPEPVSLKDVRSVGIKLTDEDVSRLAAIDAIQRFSDGDISNKEMLVFQPRSDWKFDEGGK